MPLPLFSGYGAHCAPLQSQPLPVSGFPVCVGAGKTTAPTRRDGNGPSVMRRGRILPARGPCVAARFPGGINPAPTNEGKPYCKPAVFAIDVKILRRGRRPRRPAGGWRRDGVPGRCKHRPPTTAGSQPTNRSAADCPNPCRGGCSHPPAGVRPATNLPGMAMPAPAITSNPHAPCSHFIQIFLPVCPYGWQNPEIFSSELTVWALRHKILA